MSSIFTVDLNLDQVRDLKGRFARALEGAKNEVLTTFAKAGLAEIDNVIATYPNGKRSYRKGVKRYRAYKSNGELNRRLTHRGDWQYRSNSSLHGKEYYDNKRPSYDSRYGKKSATVHGWSYSASDYWSNIAKTTKAAKEQRKILQDTLTYRKNFATRKVASSMEIYHRVVEGEAPPPERRVLIGKNVTRVVGKSDRLYPVYLENGTNHSRAFRVVETALQRLKASKQSIITRNDKVYRAAFTRSWE